MSKGKAISIRPKLGKSAASPADLDNNLQTFGAVVGNGGVAGNYIRDAEGCYSVRCYIDNTFFVHACIEDHGYEVVKETDL